MLFICPKAGECKYICGSSHDKPHNQKDGCIGYPLQGCPACIPVPSTPASHMKKISYCSVCQRETSFEDGYCLEHPNKTGGVGKPLPPNELLTDEEILDLGKKYCYQSTRPVIATWELCWMKEICQSQLLKCHQSEAAEIAELRAEVIECNNEIETLTDFKVRSMDEYEKADAEIAELKAKIERLEVK